MTLPPNFQATQDNQVCRLKKGLHGLKQANKHWHFKLANALKNQGFTRAHSNFSLFLKHTYSYFIAFIRYIDDVILTSDNMHHIQLVKNYLYDIFKIKDLGESKFFFFSNWLWLILIQESIFSKNIY